jgi:hypothetical protein
MLMNEHNDHLVSKLHCELSNPTLLPAGAATIQHEELDFAVAGVQIQLWNAGTRAAPGKLAPYEGEYILYDNSLGLRLQRGDGEGRKMKTVRQKNEKLFRNGKKVRVRGEERVVRTGN